MRTVTIALVLLTTMLCSCEEKASTDNPFFAEWDTPYGVPPFDKIENQHYLPAIKEGIKRHKAEIDAIVNNEEEPTFENTILAYDNSGELLSKVSMTLRPISRTDATPELDKIYAEYDALRITHESDIMLNAGLFAKIKTLYDKKETLGLDAQQLRLLDKIYTSFERGGINLPADKQQELRAIDEELAKLQSNIDKNVRSEQANFYVLIEKEEDLAGLSELTISAAAEEAKRRGHDGAWAFTLDKPSMLPFLQTADNRELRKQLYIGYLLRGNNDNEFDNKELINQVVNKRLERANLLGFTNHAEYMIDQYMAKTPEAVFSLLNELWTPAIKRAQAEKAEMEAIMHREGVEGGIQLWDWWYYAEKLRAEKYNLNEDELRPYFALDAVLQGMFDVTTKLWGITYKEVTNEVPLYGPENRVFEVTDKNGAHLGIVYFDFHPRASKSVGAWCTYFRGQSYKNDERVAPIISIACNFTKPSGNIPALLTLDEAETLFHEYGHALHGLFADVRYKGLSGVERDFVELPSQVMENWAFEPEVLKTYAKHYETGEVLSDELIKRIANSGLFNQGFSTVEYTAASLLDMEYHTINQPTTIDVNQFELDFAKKYNSMPEIAPRYRSTYFNHIFSGSSNYSAGYYVYIWAEVLDADAYAAFVETGDIFDQETATKFRNEVLSKGGTSDGGTLYRNFRGKDADKIHLLKNRGLVE